MLHFFLSLLLIGSLASCAQKDPELVALVNKTIESPKFGAPSGVPELIIFADYQCPACQSLHFAIHDRLKKEYIDTKRLTVIYKNYPLPGHENAMRDAHAALCGASQGKFSETRDALYAKEKDTMGRYLPEAERTSTLVSAGLDQQQYTQCMNEGWYVSKIKQDMAEGEARGINGTPSLYLGTMHLQPTSFESFFELLENGLKQK